MSPSEHSVGSSERAASEIAPLDPATNAGMHATHASNGATRAVPSDPASIASLAPREASADVACASCGAPLAPDQRYCLACGQPASPVRLAFLDVLQGEYQAPAQGIGIPGGPPPAAAYYAQPPEPDGLLGSLRRYSGLLALTGVLLASLLIGLLVGHWITGGNGGASSGKQVIEVKGLSGALAAAPAPSTTASSGSGTGEGSTGSGSGSKSHDSAKQQATEEAKDAKEVGAAKAPPVVHKKTSAQSLQKLNKTSGKQHAKEVNSLIKGDEPVETGN
jgi:hypothetical protein